MKAIDYIREKRKISLIFEIRSLQPLREILNYVKKKKNVAKMSQKK